MTMQNNPTTLAEKIGLLEAGQMLLAPATQAGSARNTATLLHKSLGRVFTTKIVGDEIAVTRIK